MGKAKKQPGRREPQGDREWQDAANAASLALIVDSCQQYGLITGGGAADVDRCLDLLARAKRRGVTPRKADVDAALRELVALPGVSIADELVTRVVEGCAAAPMQPPAPQPEMPEGLPEDFDRWQTGDRLVMTEEAVRQGCHFTTGHQPGSVFGKFHRRVKKRGDGPPSIFVIRDGNMHATRYAPALWRRLGFDEEVDVDALLAVAPQHWNEAAHRRDRVMTDEELHRPHPALRDQGPLREVRGRHAVTDRLQHNPPPPPGTRTLALGVTPEATPGTVVGADFRELTGARPPGNGSGSARDYLRPVPDDNPTTQAAPPPDPLAPFALDPAAPIAPPAELRSTLDLPRDADGRSLYVGDDVQIIAGEHEGRRARVVELKPRRAVVQRYTRGGRLGGLLSDRDPVRLTDLRRVPKQAPAVQATVHASPTAPPETMQALGALARAGAAALTAKQPPADPSTVVWAINPHWRRGTVSGEVSRRRCAFRDVPPGWAWEEVEDDD